MIGVVAGAIGGALATLLILNSPAVVSRIGNTAPEVINGDSSLANISASIETSESRVVRAVEKANPAVVSIVITKDVPIMERFFEEVPGRQFDPFGDFFGTPFSFQVPRFRQNGTQKQEVGGGSGFLVSSDGMIVTNRHVVDQSDVEYTVFLNDGTKFDAEILARDPANDLAVLSIGGTDLPHLSLADSDDLKVGQSVIAIGNALAEFRNTVSVGIISGLARSITAGNGAGQSEQLEDIIQTDAAINPGNSGGPLLNLNGDVVGVNVAVVLGSENIGFALPVNLVRGVVTSVRETGRIVRPFLGVRYVEVTTPLVEQNKLSVDYGVLIIRGATVEELAVIPGSPADKAGLVEGDIILEVDGLKLDDSTSLVSIIRRKQIGDSLTLKVLHKEEEVERQAILDELPE